MSTRQFTIALILSFMSASSNALTSDEKEAQKTEARNAKAICLMNDSLVRGKKLKECMEKEIEKNRRSDFTAKNRARQSVNRNVQRGL